MSQKSDTKDSHQDQSADDDKNSDGLIPCADNEVAERDRPGATRPGGPAPDRGRGPDPDRGRGPDPDRGGTPITSGGGDDFDVPAPEALGGDTFTEPD